MKAARQSTPLRIPVEAPRADIVGAALDRADIARAALDLALSPTCSNSTRRGAR
jgi:hypothetical protein